MKQTYRANKNLYREVNELPANAQTVGQYCHDRGCTNPYIYQLIRTQKADFEIVIFKGINFVIPLTKY